MKQTRCHVAQPAALRHIVSARTFFNFSIDESIIEDKWLIYSVKSRLNLLDKYSIEYALRAASPPEKI